MKQTTTQYEILLFTGSSFSQRQFCPREGNDNGKKLSQKEELERACWDGLLYELFPEIPGSFPAKCESFIWHILSGKNYLYISMGSNPVTGEPEASIDPYFYLNNCCEN